LAQDEALLKHLQQLLSKSRDRFYKTPFRLLPFGINFHTRTLDETTFTSISDYYGR
jgi:hypothetical protein